MMQSVLIASMNKGQLPFVCIFFIALIWIIKLPPNQLYNLLPELFKYLQIMSIWGWILFVIVTLVSFISIKYLRKVHSSEVHRLSQEKTKLQEELLKKNNEK